MTNSKNADTIKNITKQDIETTLMKIYKEINKLPIGSRERKIFDDAWKYAMKGGR